MHIKKTSILIFLGTSYHSQIKQIEQYLPHYLSIYTNVICFEFPQFSKIFKLFRHRLTVFERISNHLVVYHSIGLFPFGRYIFVFNFINHLLNYILFRLLTKSLRITKIISFTPEVYFLQPFIKNIPLIYHMLDDYSSLPWWKSILSRNQIKYLEENAIKSAQKIITASPTLFQKMIKKHTNSFLFPTPAKIKLFTERKIKFIPVEMQNIPEPIIGFIGTIEFDWKINLDLVAFLLNKLPKISFVFIGTINPQSKILQHDFINKENFYYLGYKELNKLSYYLSSCSAYIIPYATNKFGLSAYPVKTMEYLSSGRPVVTTAIPSIKYLADQGLIYWSKNKTEFLKNIKKAVKENNTELKRKRVLEAEKNDWSIRIKEYLKIIQ